MTFPTSDEELLSGYGAAVTLARVARVVKAVGMNILLMRFRGLTLMVRVVVLMIVYRPR